MELFLLYLVLQLDTLRAAVAISLGVMLVACLFGLINLGSCGERQYDWQKEGYRQGKVAVFCSFPFVVLFSVILAFLPTTKHATLLAGAYALKEVAQTDTAQRMAGKSVKLIEDWLETLEPPQKKGK